MNSPLALMVLQDDLEVPAAAIGVGLGLMALWLAVVVVAIAAMWVVFGKAGKPGWAAIVPVYNLIVLLEIAGKPIWWIVLLIIPLINFFAIAMVSLELAKRFGKGTGFGLGLLFLAPIFYPMLAWGSAQYDGDAKPVA